MSADASNRLQQPGIALKLKHYTGGVRLGEALMERMKNSRLCPRTWISFAHLPKSKLLFLTPPFDHLFDPGTPSSLWFCGALTRSTTHPQPMPMPGTRAWGGV
ncbi:Ankyrin repeat domain-containing protein 17 [Fusarium oxysporum f. sp. albedinis]|nr:Ankyrin repeat domain-containing protein 17 [Fusarium oxysporum f. sp. albedinis]